MSAAIKLIQDYYESFNQQDMNSFLNCLSDDVVHDVNNGATQIGKEKFLRFMEHMNRCYEEQVHDLVILTNGDGSRAAAEFIIAGKYLVTDVGLPEAKGQKYQLSVGAFFSINNDKISRVTNYYNFNDWLQQVT